MKIYLNNVRLCKSRKKCKNCCMKKAQIQEGIISSRSINNDTDFFVNSSGAVVFKDESKQPVLEILEGYIIKTVLSVGFNFAHKPIATIQEDDGNVICYILPDDYLDWCQACVYMSMIRMNLFPSDVVFSLNNGEYSVEFLVL